MVNSRKDKVKKADLERVVISETAPYEVPIVFLNHGFYTHCSAYKADSGYALQPLFEKIVKNDSHVFIPYLYRIRKNDISLRTLSLLHPASQFNFIKFYTEYSGLICHYCSGSPISIRYPKKIAGTVFYKNNHANINKYKNNNVTTIEMDLLAKHPASYFSYGGYSREYKFFKSEEFLNLEKKYSSLWQLDVAKCFESIYTHSVSWALKSKNFSKENLKRQTFGNDFDVLMRSSKHNETNGIVIGPEVSRIFAEIIFQDIDRNIIAQLEGQGEAFGESYIIRRYVDDIFIFSKSDKISQKVARVISSELFQYNLHLNESKHKKYSRPFFTPKSRIIFEVDLRIREFMQKFTSQVMDQDKNASVHSDDGGLGNDLVPREIHDLVGLKNSFINSVKSVLEGNFERDCANYGMVSNYIISSLTRRVTELVESGASAIKKDAGMGKYYADSIKCLLETMFFFYTVEPAVLPSYNLSKAIILGTRFLTLEVPEYEASVKQRVSELFINFYEGIRHLEENEHKDATPLEVINILLALSDMGEDYLLPPLELEAIFKLSSGQNNQLSYFEMMSCLYYIKSNYQYKEIRDRIEGVIAQKLSSLGAVKDNAEDAYILLDTLTCPFLSPAFRKKVLSDLDAQMQINLSSIGSLDQQLDYLEKNPWFIKWENIDLLTLLEKKELSAVY